MSDSFKLPDLPSAARVELIVSTFLTIAKLLSGAGLGIGAFLTTMPQDELTSIVTLILFSLGSAGAVVSWLGSRYQHYRMAKEKRDAEVSAAVASAEISATIGVPTPVVVAVTPPGEPNVAVAIPASRVIAARTAGKMISPTEVMASVAEAEAVHGGLTEGGR